MRHLKYAFLCVLVSAAFLCAQESPELKIDKLFAKFPANAPGCAVGAMQNGKVLFTRAYGLADMEHNVPLSSSSPVYMASVSKQFTAMAILLLAEDGKLQLTDTIRKTIPELPQYADAITIYQLLNHTSGVRDYLTLHSIAGLPYETVHTDEGALRLIASQDGPNFEPGSEFLYSNSGYFLLSQVVKRVSGKNLNAFAQERIFGPLGMKSTRFQHDHTFLIPGKAFGYSLDRDGWHVANNVSDVVGAGGMYSTVEDMLRWAANFEEPRIGAKALEVMQTNSTLRNGKSIGYGMGLGFIVYGGIRIIEHGGGVPGYSTEFVRVPDQKFSVVSLCNQGSTNPMVLFIEVAQAYLSAETWRDMIQSISSVKTETATATAVAPTPPPQISAEQQKEYIGDYYSKELEATYRVLMHQGVLAIQVGNRPPARLLSKGTDSWQVWGGPTDVIFQRDASGKITGFLLNSGRVLGVRFLLRN